MSRVGIASALAAFLVVVAVAVGLGASRLVARPTPTPLPAPTFTPFVFTPAPDTGPRVFQQPLSAGCATTDSVWVVSNGGGIGRFDGQRWSLVDPTLRTLVAAACSRDRMLAVGPVGRIVTADDRARTVSVDSYDIFDLLGVSLLPDGALVVGGSGQVLRQSPSGWQPYARGIEDDLYAVVAFSERSAWAVGAKGVTFHLEDAGWRAVPTGVTNSLRSVSGIGAQVVTVGDDGTALSLTGGAWQPVPLSTKATLRRVLFLGQTSLVMVGDGGTALIISETGEHAIDLRTTCDLRDVFRGADGFWIVGSDATRAGVWRIAGDRTDTWGTC